MRKRPYKGVANATTITGCQNSSQPSERNTRRHLCWPLSTCAREYHQIPPPAYSSDHGRRITAGVLLELGQFKGDRCQWLHDLELMLEKITIWSLILFQVEPYGCPCDASAREPEDDARPIFENETDTFTTTYDSEVINQSIN